MAIVNTTLDEGIAYQYPSIPFQSNFEIEIDFTVKNIVGSERWIYSQWYEAWSGASGNTRIAVRILNNRLEVFLDSTGTGSISNRRYISSLQNNSLNRLLIAVTPDVATVKLNSDSGTIDMTGVPDFTDLVAGVHALNTTHINAKHQNSPTEPVVPNDGAVLGVRHYNGTGGSRTLQREYRFYDSIGTNAIPATPTGATTGDALVIGANDAAGLDKSYTYDDVAGTLNDGATTYSNQIGEILPIGQAVNVAPVVTLSKTSDTIPNGGSYTLPNVTVTDDSDSGLGYSWSGTADVNVADDYVFTATSDPDSGGLTGSATYTLTVQEPATPAVPDKARKVAVAAGQSNMRTVATGAAQDFDYTRGTYPIADRVYQIGVDDKTLRDFEAPLDHHGTHTNNGAMPKTFFEEVAGDWIVCAAAADGSSFDHTGNYQSQTWSKGANGGLYDELVSQIQAALSFNVGNTLDAFLWCLGETAADADVSTADMLGYMNTLRDNLITDTAMTAETPWVVWGILAPEGSPTARDAINAALEQFANSLPNGAFISTVGQGYSRIDAWHYDMTSSRDMGTRGGVEYNNILRKMNAVTTTATFVPKSGRAATSLTSSTGAPEYGFSGTLDNTSQIEHSDAFQVDVDGSTSQMFETTELYRHIQNGTAEAVEFTRNYTVTSATTTGTVAIGAEYNSVTLTSITDASFYGFPVAPKAGGIILSPTNVTVDTAGVSDQADGTVVEYRLIQDGQIYTKNVGVGVDTGTSVTTTATFSASAEYTTANISSTITLPHFSSWTKKPSAGDQLTMLTADGTFNTNGGLTTNRISHDIPFWYFEASTNQIHRLSIDNTSLTPVLTQPNGVGTIFNGSGSPEYLASNAQIGTVFGVTLNTTAYNGSVVFTIIDDAGGLIGLDSDGRTLITKKLIPDNTTEITYSVRATANGTSIERTFTQAITNAALQPLGALTNVSTQPSISISENAPIGTQIGLMLRAIDPEGQTVSYELTNDAGGRFAVNPTTGDVTTGLVLDFEANQSHTITARGRTSDGRTSDATFTVNVVDVDETLPDTTKPIITLSKTSDTITVGDAWVQPTATATDNKDGDITSRIQRQGIIDPSIVGTHTWDYIVTDLAGNISEKVTYTLTVNAVVVQPDSTKPVIVLSKTSDTITVGDSWTPPTVTATDNKDGNISVNVVRTGTVDPSQVGTHQYRYNVTDQAGNAAEEVVYTLTVNAVVVQPDTTPPTVTMNEVNGQVNVTLRVGDVYTEAGATAYDAKDGWLPVTISGSVDTSQPTVTTIRYTATDSNNNSTTVERIVTVTSDTVGSDYDVYRLIQLKTTTSSPVKSRAVAYADDLLKFDVSVKDSSKKEIVSGVIDIEVFGSTYTKVIGTPIFIRVPTDATRGATATVRVRGSKGGAVTLAVVDILIRG